MAAAAVVRPVPASAAPLEAVQPSLEGQVGQLSCRVQPLSAPPAPRTLPQERQ